MLLDVTVYATALDPGLAMKVIAVKEAIPFITVTSVFPITLAPLLPEDAGAIVSTEDESVDITYP